MNINLDNARDTLCKNILIYGYCKYENKGCVFSHSMKVSGEGSATPGTTASVGANNSGSSAGVASGGNGGGGSNGAVEKKRFNMNTPSFQPTGVAGLSNKFSALSPKVKDIPVFVPSGSYTDGSSTSAAGSGAVEPAGPGKRFNVSTPSFTPSFTPEVPMGAASATSGATTNISNPPNPYLNNAPQAAQLASASSDMFYQQHTSTYPLQYHLYAPVPPPRLSVPLDPHETNASAMFIPNDLRESLQKRNEATLQTLSHSNLPNHINIYHSLVPIDKSYDSSSKVWHVPSAVYKVFSNVDGNTYVMRRLEHNFDISNEAPFKTIKKWKNTKNANVVQLQDAFTTIAFGKCCICTIYDYFPCSNTLAEHHTKSMGSKTEPITEDLLWTYFCQLVNAVKDIHSRGLAARSALDVSKIIVTNKNRIRLSSVGVNDILDYPHDEGEISRDGLQQFVEKQQAEDIRQLGVVLLNLATLTLPYSLRNDNVQGKLQALKNASTVSFSDEFTGMISQILSSEGATLEALIEKHLAHHSLKVMNNLQDSSDFIEAQMSTELENARLFRLMAKLNFIIDRPEYADWGDNSEKHLIKLFRDYVFFQYDDFGKPVVDLSHVLVSLNKLDAGIEEKFLLVTRDEKSCILVSYKEVRDIVDSAFRNITRD